MIRIGYTVFDNDSRYVLEISEARVILEYESGETICTWENGSSTDISVSSADGFTRADMSVECEGFKDNILTCVYDEDFCEFFWNIPVRELKVAEDDLKVREIMRMEVREIHDIQRI